MTVIQFSEVAEWEKTAPENERILIKEGIYRRLIEQKARLNGRTFKEVFAESNERNNRIEAELETKEAIEIVAAREGLSIYETKLNGRIEIMEIYLSTYSENPHPLLKVLYEF